MKNWKTLKEGDIVDLIAPSRGIKESEIKDSEEFIKSLGLIPRVPESLLGGDIFCSNSVEERSIQLKNALLAEDSTAVWCIRGGYGAAHLIPMLNELNIPEKSKLLIGFSDITVLNLFLNQKWGWNTLHGIMTWQVTDKQITEESTSKTTDMVFGRTTEAEFNLTAINSIGDVNIESSVIGGNLTIVQNSIGTDWQIDAQNKSLLLEEVDEEPYRVDRALTHLHQSGVFNNIDALLIGDFNSEKIDFDEKEMDETLKRFANNLTIPVFKIPNVGHKKSNYPVPLGSKATIQDCKLIIESGADV